MQENKEISQLLKLDIMARYALAGAVIGLVLISIFLMGVKHADPSWPKYWQIRPLVVVPLAGAGGGAFFYFMSRFRHHSAWVKWLAIILGVFGFFVALWIGTVLGLDGTLWN
jgi:hypothetical protein